MKISVNSPKSKRSIEFENNNIGTTFDEAIALNGKEVVYSLYVDAAVIRAQAVGRLKLDKLAENGQPLFTAEEAIKAASAYKPSVAAPRTGAGRKPQKSELDQLVEKVKAHKAGEAVMPDADFKAARSRIKELLEGIM
jgi:hypothetical protein